MSEGRESSTATTPLLTIGVPTYNRAEKLRSALESLLRQDIASFEIVVSDNASTDATDEVLREFQTRAAMVRSYRHPTTVPVTENFRTVLRLAQGRYFMWAADDDDWDPSLASTLAQYLDDHPTVVLVAPEAQYMSPEGVRLPFFPEGAAWYGNESREPADRLDDVVDHHYGNLIYGLYRRSAMITGDGTILDSWRSPSELPIFLHAASRGDIRVLDQVLFFKSAPVATYLAVASLAGVEVPLTELESLGVAVPSAPRLSVRERLGRRRAVLSFYRQAVPDCLRAIAQLPVPAAARRRTSRRLMASFARNARKLAVRLYKA